MDETRPIIMLLKSAALGELLARSLFLCAFGRRFPRSDVYAIVDPQTPDEASSLLLNPRVDYFVSVDRLTDEFLSKMLWFGNEDDEWTLKKGELARPYLFIPPNGIGLGFDAWGDLVDRTLFDFPDGIAASCRRELLTHGLDESRWFITLHIREDGYREVSDHPRSVKAVARYRGLIDHVLEIGGQVVRLGDPKSTPMQSRRGFVDLSVIPHSFLIQAYACSRSRFFIGGDSGPSVLAVGFNTPAALVNMVNCANPFSAPKNNIIATKKFRMSDGSVLRDADAEAVGAMTEDAWYGKLDRLEELTAGELCDVADLMLERAPASGWVNRRPVEMRESEAEEDARRHSWRANYFTGLR